MKPLILLFILTVSGCATGAWTHAHGDEARFRQDALECRYEAIKHGGGLAPGAGWNEVVIQRQCMEVRGYQWIRTAN